MLLSLLIACGPGGPTSDDAARAQVGNYLTGRYGEPFTVDSTEHKGRGLEGLKADSHVFVAYPTARPEQRFEGRVDFDLEPVVWNEDFLCVRDAAHAQSAVEAAAKQPGTKVVEATSTCNRDRLGTVDPRTPGAAFDWAVRLATFGPNVEDAATPLHAEIERAAQGAGIGGVESRVYVYERGQDTLLHFGDAPIPPPVAMWYLGQSQKTALDATPRLRSKSRAPAIEVELRRIAEVGIPMGHLDVRVVSDDRLGEKLTEDPDLRLAQLTADEHQDLDGWIQLAVVGSSADRGAEVRAWIQHTFETLPEGRFLPMITVAFFEDPVDTGRPLSTQPAAQREVWMYSGSVGLRIRAKGIAGIEPITAIRYVVPGD